jgi:hypothetical protein
MLSLLLCKNWGTQRRSDNNLGEKVNVITVKMDNKKRKGKR